MKKLWWSVGVLALLFAATLLNSAFVSSATHSLSGQLIRAEELAQRGDWEGARAVTLRAQEEWERRSGYLYAVLRHSDTDQVHTGFEETLSFLKAQEYGEYAAANAGLIARIGLLSDMERLSLKNIL